MKPDNLIFIYILSGKGRFSYSFEQLNLNRAVCNTEVVRRTSTAGSAIAQRSTRLATIWLEWRRRRVASRGVARVQVRRPTRAFFDWVPQLMRVTRRSAQKIFAIPPVGSRRGRG